MHTFEQLLTSVAIPQQWPLRLHSQLTYSSQCTHHLYTVVAEAVADSDAPCMCLLDLQVNPAFDSFPFTLFLGNDSSRADFLFTDNRIENTGNLFCGVTDALCGYQRLGGVLRLSGWISTGSDGHHCEYLPAAVQCNQLGWTSSGSIV